MDRVVKVKLGKLRLSPFNARIFRTEEMVDELVESIRATGKPVQPMKAHEAVEGLDPNYLYVHVGGNRLEALRRLAERGLMRWDDEVEVIATDEKDPWRLMLESMEANRQFGLTPLERYIAIARSYYMWRQQQKGVKNIDEILCPLRGRRKRAARDERSVREFAREINESKTEVFRALTIYDIYCECGEQLAAELTELVGEGYVDTHSIEELAKLPPEAVREYVEYVKSMRDRGVKPTQDVSVRAIKLRKEDPELPFEEAFERARVEHAKEKYGLGAFGDKADVIARAMVRGGVEGKEARDLVEALGWLRSRCPKVYDAVTKSPDELLKYIGRLAWFVARARPEAERLLGEGYPRDLVGRGVSEAFDAVFVSRSATMLDVPSCVRKYVEGKVMEMRLRARDVAERAERLREEIEEMLDDIRASLSPEEPERIADRARDIRGRLDEEWPEIGNEIREEVVKRMEDLRSAAESLWEHVRRTLKTWGIGLERVKEGFEPGRVDKEVVRSGLEKVAEDMRWLAGLLRHKAAQALRSAAEKLDRDTKGDREVVRRVVERGVGMVEVRLSVGELMALYRAAERLGRAVRSVRRLHAALSYGDMHPILEMLHYRSLISRDPWNAKRVRAVDQLLDGLCERVRRAVESGDWRGIEEFVREHASDTKPDGLGYIHELLMVAGEVKWDHSELFEVLGLGGEYEEALSQGDLERLRQIRDFLRAAREARECEDIITELGHRRKYEDALRDRDVDALRELVELARREKERRERGKEKGASPTVVIERPGPVEVLGGRPQPPSPPGTLVVEPIDLSHALSQEDIRRIVGGRLILYHPSRRHEGTFVRVRAGDHSFDVEVVVQPLPSMASSRGPPGRGGRGGEGRELRRALVDRERKRRADLDF